MKNRLLAAVCTLALLCMGCGVSDGPQGETVDIYRVVEAGNQAGGELLRTETLEREDGQSSLEFILSQLQEEPGSPELGRSMPEEVKIISGIIVEREMLLELSEEYLELSGIEKTLTDYCIALSLLELDEIQTVSIYVDGVPITRGLSSSDVLLYDGEESPYEKQVRLYFAESGGRYLDTESRTLSVSDDTSLERYVIDELLRGPNDEALVSAIPEGTSLVSISTADGLCSVCFSEEFYSNRPDTFEEERLAVYSIVNSLTSLAEIEEVLITIEGMQAGSYVYMDLSEPIASCESLIGPVNSARGEMDVDIYMAIPGMDKITPVPYIVDRDEYLSIEACVFLAMTEVPSEGGAISLLEQCGEPNFIATINGVCRIDLPEGYFVSCGDNGELAVEAIVATMCSLEGVNSVRITTDGQELELNGHSYAGDMTINEEIILH